MRGPHRPTCKDRMPQNTHIEAKIDGWGVPSNPEMTTCPGPAGDRERESSHVLLD